MRHPHLGEVLALTGWPTGRSRDGGIDEIPLVGVPGRLSLCGNHAIGPDVEAALARAGATHAVCLTERHELLDRYPGYVEWLDQHRDDRAIWFPIHDLHAPDLDRVGPFLDRVVAVLDSGNHVLMHCGAGIGRAGTLAVCVLMRFGTTREEAMRVVAANRPMAGPEVGAQQELILALERQSAP